MLRATPPWDWPEDADKELLVVLRDDGADEANRIRAAAMAGDCTVVNDELVEALLAILHNVDDSDQLRGRAAIALGPVLEYTDEGRFDDFGDALISERTFDRIQKSLHELYADASVPKFVRRRILEATVRAPQDWHQAAIRTAYASGDEDWMLTAVFSMHYVRGFDDQILKALRSEKKEIHYEAVRAAGAWAIDSAWTRVKALVSPDNADKALLLAAIDAVASIRPEEAGMILVDLLDSEDEDIAEAAQTAIAVAEGQVEEFFDDDDIAEDEFLH